MDLQLDYEDAETKAEQLEFKTTPQPTTEASDKVMQPATEASDKVMKPTTEGNDKVMKPTTEGNDKVTEHVITS